MYSRPPEEGDRWALLAGGMVIGADEAGCASRSVEREMMLYSDFGVVSWDVTVDGRCLQDGGDVVAVELSLAEAEGGAEAQRLEVSMMSSEPVGS